jgi:hypothetical protein
VYFKLLKYNNGKKDGHYMDFLTVKEAGKRWGITGRMVTYYCVNGRIPGAIKKGNLWHVPCEAEKPVDGRYKQEYSEDRSDD